jgi:hypothetical protein
VIEGEGLGGFARRHPINVMRGPWFLALYLNFLPRFRREFWPGLSTLAVGGCG